MHRDVSAGNLLIYPHVRRTADGKYRIYWQGILADWELAKHVSKTVAMQPQRTVCNAHTLLHYIVPHKVIGHLAFHVRISP